MTGGNSEKPKSPITLRRISNTENFFHRREKKTDFRMTLCGKQLLHFLKNNRNMLQDYAICSDASLNLSLKQKTLQSFTPFNMFIQHEDKWIHNSGY